MRVNMPAYNFWSVAGSSGFIPNCFNRVATSSGMSSGDSVPTAIFRPRRCASSKMVLSIAPVRLMRATFAAAVLGIGKSSGPLISGP
jgi:hypothetical protein